jgi:hypothetical protein
MDETGQELSPQTPREHRPFVLEADVRDQTLLSPAIRFNRAGSSSSRSIRSSASHSPSGRIMNR